MMKLSESHKSAVLEWANKVKRREAEIEELRMEPSEMTAQPAEMKAHWVDGIRSNSRLWWTFCGLCSPLSDAPYRMVHNKSEVTCKNCLRGSRPKEHLDE